MKDALYGQRYRDERELVVSPTCGKIMSVGVPDVGLQESTWSGLHVESMVRNRGDAWSSSIVLIAFVSYTLSS